MVLWPACHEFDSSATENLPCGGVMQRFKEVREVQSSPVSVMWKLGCGVPVQVSFSSLDHSSELRILLPKAFAYS
ncbi:hypothetical protein TNCV_2409041 [Trichonephila clavipes]|nr:hypothetical protein TNCV_2409041 [Trichonephila clavipes]